jgi:hypothetical protein
MANIPTATITTPDMTNGQMVALGKAETRSAAEIINTPTTIHRGFIFFSRFDFRVCRKAAPPDTRNYSIYLTILQINAYIRQVLCG